MTYTYPTGRTVAEVYDELHRTPRYGTLGHGKGAEHLVAGATSLLDAGCGRSDWAWEQGIGVVFGIDIAPVAVDSQLRQGRECAIADLAYLPPLIAGGLVPPNALVGYDELVINGVTLWGQARVADAAFDTVTCFDTLEHLPESDVPAALHSLCRIAARRVVLSIAYKPAVHRGAQGEELHLTVRPVEWWLERVTEAATGLKPGARVWQDGKFIVVDMEAQQ